MRRALPEEYPLKFQNLRRAADATRNTSSMLTADSAASSCALGIEAIGRQRTDRIAVMSVFFPHPGDQQPWDDGQDIFAELAVTLAGLEKGLRRGPERDGWEGIRVGSQDEEYLQGYADGKAGLQACLAAGLL